MSTARMRQNLYLGRGMQVRIPKIPLGWVKSESSYKRKVKKKASSVLYVDRDLSRNFGELGKNQ